MRSFSTKWLYSDIHREKGDDDVNDDVSSVLFFFFAFVIVARFLMSCVRLAGASLESLSSQSNGLDSANSRLDKPERYASKRFRWEFTTFRSRCRPVFVGQFFWRRVSSPRSSRGAARLSQTPTVGSGCHEGRRRVEEENARKYDADEEAHLSVPSDEPVWLSKLVNLVNPRRILRVFVRVFPAHAWCYYWRWYRV